MRKLLLTFAAIAVVAVGLPNVANAHPDDDSTWQRDDWNNGGDSFAEFNQEYRHIWNGIMHGVSDGSYTPREADYFYRQMQTIRAQADWQAQRGYYDGDQLQASLQRLHDRMHDAHERGHERENRYEYNNEGYGYRQPSSYGYGQHPPYEGPDGYRYQDHNYSLSFGVRR